MESTSSGGRKRLLSGIKPTGRIHIGNYFGALKQFVDLQNDYDTFVMVANLHALTGNPTKEAMLNDTYNLILDYLGAGLDPEKVTLFKQSDVPAHANLRWVFNNLVSVPYLMRAHAFKGAINRNAEDLYKNNGYLKHIGEGISEEEKVKKISENVMDTINVGTFDYPVLMAADILLYDTDVVPVGKDQKQHIEYARDIALKFESKYGFKGDFPIGKSIFKLPQDLIIESVATVPGTDGQKMSKSYNNTIPLFATDDEIAKAVMSIPTDSRGKDEAKDPDELVLYQIHKLFNDSPELRAQYAQGLGYGDAKKLLIADIISFVTPLRERRTYYENNPKLVDEILVRGAMRANDIAMEKLRKVYGAVGLIS